MEFYGPDEKLSSCADDTMLLDLVPRYEAMYKAPIAVGVVNGEAVPLRQQVKPGDHVRFLDLDSAEGYKAYINTFMFALIAAMSLRRPEIRLEVENTFGSGLYCDIKNKIVLSKYDLADVSQCMQAMIDAR